MTRDRNHDATRSGDRTQLSHWTTAAQLFGLSGFAFAQPVFDLLTRHGEFLVAHRVNAVELGVVSVGLLVVPALIAWLIVRGCGALSPEIGRFGYRVCVAILLVLMLLPGLNAAFAMAQIAASAVVVVGLATVLGWLGAIAISRIALANRLVSMLGVAPLVFLAVFTASGLFARLSVGTAAGRFAPVETSTPIVLIVFDELPLTSLLDGAGQIDRALFPNFARLADTSTWFLNASTVDWQTPRAVPSILTGRFPNDGLPVLADHPANLLSWLAGSMQLHVVETHTMLSPLSDRPPHAQGHERARLASMLGDLGVLYLHIIAPSDLASRLPAIDQRWTGFGEFGTGGASPKETLNHLTRQAYGQRGSRFRHFVESMPRCSGACLNFTHVLLPHWSWVYAPSGRQYHPHRSHGLVKYRWGDELWWTTQGYQQHLLQLAFVDRLLGELMERLEALDLFERAALIVTADHGAVFHPNQEQRRPNRAEHPEEILSIPLFVKAPHQQTATRSLRNVETIDILPLIADLIGAALPFPVDGCSPFDSTCRERPLKVIYGDDGRPIEFPARLEFPSKLLAHKLELFGSGTGLEGLFRVGPRADLVGRRIDELRVARATPAKIALVHEAIGLARRAPERFTLGRITGWLDAESSHPPPPVAIARDGVILAVAPAFESVEGGLAFSALVPESPVGQPLRGLRFYLVEKSRGEWTLRKARIEMTDRDPRFSSRR